MLHWSDLDLKYDFKVNSCLYLCCAFPQNAYTYMMGTCVIVLRFFTICGKHVSNLSSFIFIFNEN